MQVIEDFIYAIVTMYEDISSVVVSEDVIVKMGQDIQNEMFGNIITVETVGESMDCVCHDRIVQRLRYPTQFYLAGIPTTISSHDNTCFIVLSNGNKIEFTSRIEEEITFEVEDLERIWYGGF